MSTTVLSPTLKPRLYLKFRNSTHDFYMIAIQKLLMAILVAWISHQGAYLSFLQFKIDSNTEAILRYGRKPIHMFIRMK